jgi:GMP synthase (glutamine-hydrolysing)
LNPICILKTGSTLPEIARRLGDFEDWICRGMQVARDDVRVVDVCQGEALPDPADLAGVVITGSSAMVSEREPWSEAAAAWIPGLIALERPLLGICYGHQLIAHALGGSVADNPLGREIGTAQVRMAGDWKDDPLLGVLSAEFPAQVSHLQSVITLPRGAQLYGASPGDPHQVCAFGERTWSVQFHPEFDAEIVRGYIAGRREVLLEEGLDPEALASAARDGVFGDRMLARFAQLVREAQGGGIG